jgi:LmbE family N-acetylglucosaminyl deacetylase
MRHVRPGNLRLFLTGAAWLAAALFPAITCAQQASTPPVDSYTWNNRPPDPRFKADILLVVAHPDDEVMAGAYLAREIFDHHKRVAVVFQNPGDGGVNDVGPEQGVSLGAVRQIEGRRAVASLGITNVWFLNGHDTYSQDPLASLEHCGHGTCLDQLVRIMRITRPSIVLTWMTGFTTGENHSDHQASGVLATEAFDLAGDPTFLSEQVSPVINPNQAQQMTEGLRPWQPEKLYYFYNPTHNDIFDGKGPQYPSDEISPSRHESYGLIAAEENTSHQSQGGFRVQQEIDKHNLEKSHDEIAKIATGPTRFILGKSLVPSGITDDVFTGVVPEGIAYVRPPGYVADTLSQPTLVIGDPWRFYQRLWQAHDLKLMPGIVPIEVTIHTGGILSIPLVIENPLDHPIQVTLSTQAPDGWKLHPVAPVSVDPHSEYYVRVQADAPATKLPGWQSFTVTGTADGQSLGPVPIRIELSNGWVAPQ